MTKPEIEVKSQLVFCQVVGLREYKKISPATAINDSNFGKGIAIKTSTMCRILAKFEDLCVVRVVE